MKVLIKRPFERPIIAEIKEDLAALQKSVNGSIENAGELEKYHINIWINRDAKIFNFDPNFSIYGGKDIVLGTAVFTGFDDEGASISLTNEQIKIIKKYLSRHSI